MPEDNSIAFLDTKVHVEDSGTVSFGIYRKPTHTDQYLHFDSHHHAKQKIGIIKTFRHRINTIITKEQDKLTEEAHVKAERSSQKLRPPRMVPERTEIQEERQDSQAG